MLDLRDKYRWLLRELDLCDDVDDLQIWCRIYFYERHGLTAFQKLMLFCHYSWAHCRFDRETGTLRSKGGSNV